MFGGWLGMTLILPCLGLYWLINPRFLFPHKNLTRLNVLSFIALMVFLEVAMLIAIVQLKDGVNRYDVIGFILTLVVCFYLSAWLFYEHGQRSVLLKMPKQTINHHDIEAIENSQENNTPSAQLQSFIHQEINHQDNLDKNHESLIPNNTNDELVILDSVEHGDVAKLKPNIAHNDSDWQAYKQKMEQSWQETRKTLTEKMEKKKT